MTVDATWQAGTGDDAEGTPAARRYSAITVAAATAGGVVVAFLLAWAYGPAEHYSPLVYLNFVLAYGLAWLLGKACCAVLRRKRIDGAFAAWLVGAASGVAAVWFAWLVYIWVIFDYDFEAYFEALANPAFVFEVAAYLAHHPLWGLGRGGKADPAFFYYAAWTAEFLCIVGVASWMCRTFVRENLLCADCGAWVTETGDLATFLEPPPGPEAFELNRIIAGGDVSALATLERPAPDSQPTGWLEAKGYACADCADRDGYVTVLRVEMAMNKKTKKLERRQKILTRFAPVGVELEKKIFEPAASGAADAAGAGEPGEISGKE